MGNNIGNKLNVFVFEEDIIESFITAIDTENLKHIKQLYFDYSSLKRKFIITFYTYFDLINERNNDNNFTTNTIKFFIEKGDIELLRNIYYNDKCKCKQYYIGERCVSICGCNNYKIQIVINECDIISTSKSAMKR